MSRSKVVSVIELYDTHGLPMVDICECLQERGLLPDWIEFFVLAMKKGWNPWTAYNVLRGAVEVVYDAEFLAAWEVRMKHCLIQILPIELDRRAL